MFCNVYKTSLLCFSRGLAVRNANTKSGKTYVSHKIKLNDYLDEINALYLKNFLPPKLLRLAKFSEQLYLIDDYVAGNISEKIGINLSDSSLVVETNPGLGILTKRLLDNGVRCINLYESNPHFFPHICTLKNNYEENIMLYKINLLESMKLTFQDRMDNGSREQEIIQSFPKRRWAEDPPVPIIATLTSTYFIRYLLMSFFMQNGLMFHCRPDLYLIVPLIIHNALMSEGSKYYRTISLLFRLTFKVTLLTKVPRGAFLPWMQKSKRASKQGEDSNNQEMYLIQATARPDFYKTVVPQEKMRELWYFISLCFTSPKAFVIPYLEKYIPNCGTRLIFRDDLNIYTRFSDLSLEQILSLFRQFTSWPEYSISVFNDSIQTLFMKSNITFEEMERHLYHQDNENQEEIEQ